MAQPLAAPFSQFLDSNGIPLAGGKVYTYVAGTLTPQNSYTDSTGVTPAANPVILDSGGRATIWLSGYYKIIVKDSLDNVIHTDDNITALGATGDMNKSVYDAANIQEQLVGLTAVQTLTNKSLTTPIVTNSSTLKSITGANNIIYQYTATSGGGALSFGKSRNAAIDSHTIVQDGDNLGGIYFYGSNGTAFDLGAYITAYVNGTPGAAADMPMRLAFFTSPDGSATALQRVNISAAGLTSLYKGADVASATTITPTGNLFHVTGTTTITSVSGTGITAGTQITIIFDGALTFTDGSNLKLAGNFVTTADDTITLTYDGTNWYEVSRSVN